MTSFVSWSRSKYIYESGSIQPTDAEDLIISIANEAQTHTLVLDPLSSTLGISSVYVKYVGQTFYTDTGLVFDVTDSGTYILTVQGKISSVKLITTTNFDSEITLRVSGVPDIVPAETDVDAIQEDIDKLMGLTVGAAVIDFSAVPEDGTYTVTQEEVSGIMVFTGFNNTGINVVFPSDLIYAAHTILYPYTLDPFDNFDIYFDAVEGSPNITIYGGQIAAYMVLPSFDAIVDIESLTYLTKVQGNYASGNLYEYEVNATEAASGAISFGEYYAVEPFRDEMIYATNIRVSNTGAHVLASDPMTMVMYDMDSRIWKITNNIANDIEFYGEDLGNTPIVIPSGESAFFFVQDGEVIRARKQSIRKITNASTVTRFDQIILADGTFNVTMYDANTFIDEFTISNVGAGTVTMVCSGTDEILNGTTSTTEAINTGESRRFVVDKSGVVKKWVML